MSSAEDVQLARQLLELDDVIRYVAVLRGRELGTVARSDLTKASSAESDRYEELLVNPTLLELAMRRGEIDCGGLEYLVLRYGYFFQLVIPRRWGHVSVAVEECADPVAVAVVVCEQLADMHS